MPTTYPKQVHNSCGAFSLAYFQFQEQLAPLIDAAAIESTLWPPIKFMPEDFTAPTNPLAQTLIANGYSSPHRMKAYLTTQHGAHWATTLYRTSSVAEINAINQLLKLQIPAGSYVNLFQELARGDYAITIWLLGTGLHYMLVKKTGEHELLLFDSNQATNPEGALRLQEDTGIAAPGYSYCQAGILLKKK